MDNRQNTGELYAVSPLDGRYKNRVADLSLFLSEYALIATRIEVELCYLLSLSEVGVTRKFTRQEKKDIKALITDIDEGDILAVKDIEITTRHDLKAVEKMLRLKLQKTTLRDVVEKIHFGLTSDDINNIAYRLMLYRGVQRVLLPELDKILSVLVSLSKKHKALPMLARTHGQAAVPTTLGKEIAVFATRLNRQFLQLRDKKLTGKLNGAVGNYNALVTVYPSVDWVRFTEEFTASLGLVPNLITTQINPYDDVIEYFQILIRINNIIVSLDQDMWRYISDNWFVQEARKGEVGSSTMPQKVNPIDFENSEGNLGLANSLLEYMARKLSASRLQRDLTDSTTLRNCGTVLGYSLIGYKSLLSGMARVRPNKSCIHEALCNDWSILTEGVQTILRDYGVDDPYSLIASLSRGEHIGQKDWQLWVETLPLDIAAKQAIISLTPQTYTGLSEKLTEKTIQEIQKSRK